MSDPLENARESYERRSWNDAYHALLRADQASPLEIDDLERLATSSCLTGRNLGTAGVANYFHQPFGPGWALVGDAGYDKDPITAQGISDAFIDAEALTEGLHDGWSGRRPLGVALASYQSRRDERAKPMYDFTCQQATLEPTPPPMQQLFEALRGDQEATDRFFSAITGSLPLPAFMNPENIGRILESAESRA